VYGKGGQTRGFLNIRDTLRYVELAILSVPRAGEYRVFNQFTETYDISELAELVVAQAQKASLSAGVHHIENPRWNHEDHRWDPASMISTHSSCQA
jgi:UDP-sulfoquinovose synthase